MPDVYSKGQPHTPMTTVTGHYLGMQPVAAIHEREVKPTERWYRGDDYAALKAELDDVQSRYDEHWLLSNTTAGERDAALKRIAGLEAQLARRPPKRAPVRG